MSDLLPFAVRVHDISVEKAKYLRFNKDFRADGALMCSYATLIEHFGGLIALAKAEKRTSSTTVFRSLLEAFVQFKILFDDRNYLDHMLVKYHEDWSAILKRAKDGSNPILYELGQVIGLEERLAEYQAEVERFKSRGIRSLKIRERFQRAGMDHEYTSVYAVVSRGAHNDLEALRKRHAVMSNGDYGLHIYRTVVPSDFRTELHGGISFLLTAGWMVHDYLKSEAKPQFESLIGDLQTELREPLA